jgi:hypothetical protein
MERKKASLKCTFKLACQAKRFVARLSVRLMHSLGAAYSTALTMSSITFLASPNTIMVLSM